MAKVIYNNLSQKFKDTVGWDKPLKAEEKIEFQWINIPTTKQNGEMLPYYGTKRIPNVDSVFDQWAEGGPRMVQIAYIESETGSENKPYTFGEIHFKKEDKCVITITGREPKKLPLINYLRACNANQNNPLANPSTMGYLFKELEPAKTAKQKRKEINELKDALNYIDEMEEAKAISLLQALKQPIHPTEDENKLALATFIQDKGNRDKFNRLSTDVRMPIAALVEKASSKEVDFIRYEEDPKTWVYSSTGRLITQVPPQTNPITHLVEYFHNNEHGKAVKEFIEAEIGMKNTEKSLEIATENLEQAEVKTPVKRGPKPKVKEE